MPAVSKVQDLPEALAWLREGRPYKWIVDEYVRKYGVRTTVSMWSVLRRRHNIERRIVRDELLIPWQVDPEHRHGHAIAMLRAEARRRAGVPLTPKADASLRAWRKRLKRDRTVVLYDRTAPGGWRYVPRREHIDLDLIREPNGRSRKSSQERSGITSKSYIVYDDGRVVPFDSKLLSEQTVGSDLDHANP